VQFDEKRHMENGAGRRAYDGYCPLHGTHHDDIGILKQDMKSKISVKLFGIFVGSSITVALVIAGWIIASQAKIVDSVQEIQTQATRIEAKVDFHLGDFENKNSRAWRMEPESIRDP